MIDWACLICVLTGERTTTRKIDLTAESPARAGVHLRRLSQDLAGKSNVRTDIASSCSSPLMAF